MAKMIVVDERLCVACKTCVLECAMAHSDASTLAEAIASESPPQPRMHVEPFGRFGVPLQCRHCEDAPCIMICPTKAISRTGPESPVLLDAERCTGCKMCMIVCPFGVIDLSRDGKAMIKCDLCIERTEKGEEPACVSSCPTGALKFVEVDDFLRQRRRQAVACIAAAEQGTQVDPEDQDGSDAG